MHGHEHHPEVQELRGTQGSYHVVWAGAMYDEGGEDAYALAYNYVTIDLNTGAGAVYLRRWSTVRGAWHADTELYEDRVYHFDIPVPDLGQTSLPRTEVGTSAADQSLVGDWCRHVADQYSYADHRGIAGIAGAPLAAALPADEVYVIPSLVPADRPELAERERELLELSKTRIWMDSNVRGTKRSTPH